MINIVIIIIITIGLCTYLLNNNAYAFFPFNI